MADIPDLSGGTYKLEIVTRWTPGVIKADPELTVETA
jgi:hypothetical protein